MRWKSYPNYKESGVQWLGAVPEHWNVKKLRYIAFLRSGDSVKSEEIEDTGRYPVFGGNGLRGFVSRFTHQGEYVLIGRQGALCGNINYTSGAFCASEHAIVVSPLTQVEHIWLGELLRAMDLNQYSVSAAQPGLSVQMISGLAIPVPPHHEQVAIAQYLKREIARIETLISKQQRLIELLQEKRQALISHAVTKGLNPHVPMKHSGVEWLGEVPAHWKLRRLSRITLEKCDGPFGSGLKSEHYQDKGVRVIRLQNIRSGTFDDSDKAFIEAAYFETAFRRHSVLSGDLLIAGLGDDNHTVGRCCVAPTGISPAMVKADCFRFRIDPSLALPHFVACQLSAGAVFDAGMLATGSTRSRIPLSTMASRMLAMPPLQEQASILDFVRVQLEKIGSVIDRAHRSISLMHEHRSALISAAVTGKIDVREIHQSAHA